MLREFCLEKIINVPRMQYDEKLSRKSTRKVPQNARVKPLGQSCTISKMMRSASCRRVATRTAFRNASEREVGAEAGAKAPSRKAFWTSAKAERQHLSMPNSPPDVAAPVQALT